MERPHRLSDRIRTGRGKRQTTDTRATSQRRTPSPPFGASGAGTCSRFIIRLPRFVPAGRSPPSVRGRRAGGIVGKHAFSCKGKGRLVDRREGSSETRVAAAETADQAASHIFLSGLGRAY